jgi:cob(I)alamin adenosyltransferase
MVTLNRIYTRTGDAGDTALGSGARVSQTDLRVAAYGTVDEANAVVGLARLHAQGALDAMLGRTQNDLFDLGADLAVPDTGDTAPDAPARLRVTEAQVDRLESEIDLLNERLAPLRSFVLPGGSPCSAHLHQARTVVRRAERDVVALSARDAINPQAVRYLNRLSDLLFVLARHANDDGARDVLWVPGAHR